MARSYKSKASATGVAKSAKGQARATAAKKTATVKKTPARVMQARRVRKMVAKRTNRRGYSDSR